MAVAISSGVAQPAGYIQTNGHNGSVDGTPEFTLVLRRFICGLPEIDRVAGVTTVGTFDSTIRLIDVVDTTAATGTYNIRRLNGTTIRVTDPGATNHDVTVTWGTAFEFNGDGTESVPISFRIDDTGADPLADAEGWDFDLVTNGLAAADRWHTEVYSNQARSSVIECEFNLRARQVAGQTNPALVPDEDKVYFHHGQRSDPNNNQWATFNRQISDPNQPFNTSGSTSTFQYVIGWEEFQASGPRPVEYWITANHRFVSWITLVNGNYYAGFMGLMDPFATRLQYPLAAINGGCAPTGNFTFSDIDDEISSPHMSTGNMTYRDINGNFIQPPTPFQDQTNSAVNINGTSTSQVWPWGCGSLHSTQSGLEESFPGSEQHRSVGIDSVPTDPIRGGIDGANVFIPATIIDANGVAPFRRHTILGHIPQIFWTNGNGPTTGSIVTTGGRDFVISQNATRTLERGFWALELV